MRYSTLYLTHFNKLIVKLILIILLLISLSINTINASADSLNDSINEQLNDIDLSEIENIISEIDMLEGYDFNNTLNKLISGDFSIDYSSFFNSIIKLILNNFIKLATFNS